MIVIALAALGVMLAGVRCYLDMPSDVKNVYELALEGIMLLLAILFVMALSH